MAAVRERLHGWGRTAATAAEVRELAAAELPEAVRTAGPRGALARGLGRSYGDAAQNSGGTVLRLHGPVGDAAAGPVDPVAGCVTVAAGTSLGDLLVAIVPQGWFVQVLPGTRHVTVGGAIASDIHGKNHHVEGSIGNHVLSMRLLLADGSVEDIAPDRRPELFWATIGGMGLTGVVLDATLRLLPIETSRMAVDTDRLPDLDAVFAAMTEGDDRYRYSVAWIDLLAKGAHLGRSVLTRGDHARLEQLPPGSGDPLAYRSRQLVAVPPIVPTPGLLNHATIAAFNELWFRKAPRHREGELVGTGTFFCPLDLVGHWNRLYGRQGMLQYQFVVPFGQEATMRRVIERLVASGTASFLAVLKRFGVANLAPLSFPSPGWTLALDIPAGSHGLGEMLHELDQVVLDAGGRHYFAKDAHTTPAAIRRGYPRLDEWRAVRDGVDPGRVWQSDLARRLDLLERSSEM
ncbi:MAG: decaprenylphosphoryl-beta-D-ribose oxidase [Ilumatobacteraceae bacterium]|nr:decaprenylphosphoryl-beta-D-ribose oxidase [Ilumatobacteraceae bacterium]